MKLSYLMPLSAENIATAARLGYDGLEANVGWLDKPTLAELEANLDPLRDALKEHDLVITAVSILGGTLEVPFEDAVAYYGRAIALAQRLGCSVIAGFTGRDNSLTVDENLPAFERYFTRIAAMAADRGVRVALEPWPGNVVGHGPYRWRNLATTPELWDRLFDVVPSPALGLEYDPSHLVWQGIDHLAAIRSHAERIHHVHAKDIVIDQALLSRVGVHGRGWWRFVLPGLGCINWDAVLSTLRGSGYNGGVAVEHEDRDYAGRRWNEGLAIALKTLRPLVDAYSGR
ncbi:MAG: sugar phosphate isomerase/epimerase [Anaerolineae bacterium]|nr:sugar phosphate isomerase/epimerase [Anaerolineae bacterium]